MYLVGLHIYYKMKHVPYNIKSQYFVCRPCHWSHAEPVKFKVVLLNSQTCNYAVQFAKILKIKVHGKIVLFNTAVQRGFGLFYINRKLSL